MARSGVPNFRRTGIAIRLNEKECIVNRPLVCLLAVLALDAPVSGQSTAFEVVSIKPAPQTKKELQRHLGTRIDPAMVDLGGVSIMMLITRA